jgi:hypothetical protein
MTIMICAEKSGNLFYLENGVLKMCRITPILDTNDVVDAIEAKLHYLNKA